LDAKGKASPLLAPIAGGNRQKNAADPGWDSTALRQRKILDFGTFTEWLIARFLVLKALACTGLDAKGRFLAWFRLYRLRWHFAAFADVQWLAANAHILQMAQDFLWHAIGQLDQTVIFENGDLADMARFESSFVGNRADDIGGRRRLVAADFNPISASLGASFGRIFFLAGRLNRFECGFNRCR